MKWKGRYCDWDGNWSTSLVTLSVFTLGYKLHCLGTMDIIILFVSSQKLYYTFFEIFQRTSFVFEKLIFMCLTGKTIIFIRGSSLFFFIKYLIQMIASVYRYVRIIYYVFSVYPNAVLKCKTSKITKS